MGMTRVGLLIGLFAGAGLASVRDSAAQTPPTPEQARAMLRQRPDLAARIQEWLGQSGLSAEQIRSRLSAAGYSPNMLDAYLPGVNPDSLPAAGDNRLLSAVRALGIVGTEDASLLAADTVPGKPGERRRDLPTEKRTEELEVFGTEVFRRVSSQFQPSPAGPVDASYRLGPGDVLVLILTGDVETAHTLEVTREGFVVIPQVGQVYVGGLTLAQLENVLFQRLGRVYSGVRRTGATTRFEVTVARLRTNQVYVIGEVVRPGSYQISSAGTVLNALYLAGGPQQSGSFRRVEVRRAGKQIDSLDLYDYLLRGNNSHDIRLETGDVVFVRLRGSQISIQGAITRPAIYELTPGETLRDLIAAAGDFEPFALRRRVQVDRILPPSERGPGGRDRVVLDIGEDQFSAGEAPPFPLAAGDRVNVFAVADRRRNVVAVNGNVWTEGPVGYQKGMKLSEAIRLAGGPKPDVYLGQILVSRLNPDSTRSQLRSAFRDSTGAVTNDLVLQEDDDIRVYSRTTFRPTRTVSIVGAVKTPGQLPYRDGMTLRDAVLEADGLTEDALLATAEIARLPEDRTKGSLAATLRVAIDSSYLFDRAPNGEYKGPPGLPGRAGGAPEVLLNAYDNVLIFRQPGWELHRTVILTGKVKFPGTYSLMTRSDRLTDLIERAGGLTNEAYARGAELYRTVRTDSATAFRVIGRLARLETRLDSSNRRRIDSADMRLRVAQRVGIDLPRALKQPRGRDDPVLQSGDSIWVPEYDPTVRVIGAVNSPASVLYRRGWNLDSYVAAAGGFSRRADKGRAYLVQPGGQVESVKRRFFLPDGKPSPEPGAVVYVPARDPADRRDWAGFLGSLAQILASTVAIIVVATR